MITSIEGEEDRANIQYSRNVLYAFGLAVNWISFGFTIGFSANSDHLYVKTGILSGKLVGIYSVVLGIGAVLGCWLFSFLAYRIGIKRLLLISSLLGIYGWWSQQFILTLQPEQHADINYLSVLSRLLIGLGCGISSVCLPVLIVSNIENEHRNTFGCLPVYFFNLGFLLSCLANWLFINIDNHANLDEFDPIYLSNKIMIYKKTFGYFPILGIILNGLSLLINIKLPRRVYNNNDRDMEQQFYDPLLGSTNAFENFHQEMALIKEGYVKKQLTVGCFFMIFQQLLGIFALLFNFSLIFVFKMPENYDPSLSSLISLFVGGIMFISSFSSICANKFLYHRTTLTVSSLLLLPINISMIIYGKSRMDNQIIPSIFSLLFILLYNSSWGTLSWLITGEMFAGSIPRIGSCVCSSCFWIAFSFVTGVFPTLFKKIGVSGVFGIFLAVNIFSLFFVNIFVPETRGKSLEEIQNLFKESQE